MKQLSEKLKQLGNRMRAGSLEIDFLGNLWLTPPPVRDGSGEIIDELDAVKVGPMSAEVGDDLPADAAADFAELLDEWLHTDSAADLRREWSATYRAGLGDSSRW